MNIVGLIGRITYPLEMKVTPSGVSVLRFQIAVDRNYTPKGEERKADFIDCVAWRGTAEFIGKYFKKGDLIAIDGSIQTENYTDKNGNKRKSVDVVVNNASFCGAKSAESESTATPSLDVSTNDFEEIIDDDDVPF